MIGYSEIRDVHLEISTLCNASCPWCPRNFWGYPFNGGYPEINLTLENAKKIFSDAFLNQLSSIRINGNFGDIVMNPESADIIEYFKNSNPGLMISVSTNGSGRNKDFWTRLGAANIQVIFALDGLEDTHHLYRQNTSWKQILKNAKTFISAGGIATWKMIKFDHNHHQIGLCRSLSQELGFQRFELVAAGRDTAPVFDRYGNFTHVLGNYQGPTEFKMLFHKKQNDEILLEDILPGRTPCQSVTCETKKLKSIYISANGDVFPCCWTGLYPRTYGKGQYHQAANAQLVPMMSENNALEYSLEQCIGWFQMIENSWKIDHYEKGRLVICDDNCGSIN
jgi:MoaA/NifB/PqqE/SkfB family radical SAM enzyme